MLVDRILEVIGHRTLVAVTKNLNMFFMYLGLSSNLLFILLILLIREGGMGTQIGHFFPKPQDD